MYNYFWELYNGNGSTNVAFNEVILDNIQVGFTIEDSKRLDNPISEEEVMT